MTTHADSRAMARAVVEKLTGPGGPFELAKQEVLGTSLPVFTHRRRALHELLAESVRHGDRDYIVTADSRLTFREHAAQVASLARTLREEYGVGPGDRVAIAAANSPEWIVTFWATVSIGAIAVGYNAWWSTRELAYGLEHTTPTLVVADAKRAAQLQDSDVRVLTIEGDIPRLAARHAAEPLPTCDVAEDDPAVILYTSGTSGRPKGATHSHRNLLSVAEYHRMNDALAAAFGDPTDPRDRTYLLALPLFHIASLHNLAVPRLANGSKIALHHGAFDVDRVLRLIQDERVTNWGAIPTMANRLLAHGDLSSYDLSSLTAFSLASAPSSPAFQERLRKSLTFATGALVDSYGLTESCTAISVATTADLNEDPGTLGYPIVGVQLEIRDVMGRPVPDGVEGEICVRSAYTMLGYWNDPAATADAIGADRWLHTGDIGLVREGRVRLTSRRSDLIIRGGENVYPAEVEAALAEHPLVTECVVLGVPHEDLGQEVAAVIVTDAALNAEELCAFAGERLGHFKVPTHWTFTDRPLPRNATGKVVRRDVTV
ncbi:Long-chain-fatty-acid--CoA ligase [Alloactinosynnema sp. L-07]|uniref:class I adenylate-forming enzyme family protein n=1 Tax=Alloactinosynnema sp. L-07 TaxID=1653480 RepID=UPI00065EF8CB|nr:AMP-binding protein [Alloactinosynnema sp. L-07]CRK57795.1 Long-chain-fatty-acid--CoA ligase [Alloactinosynnema sp. L-07]